MKEHHNIVGYPLDTLQAAKSNLTYTSIIILKSHVDLSISTQTG